MCKKMSYIKKRNCQKIASLVMTLFCFLSFIAPAAYASGHNGEYPIAELTLGNSFGMKNIQRIGWGDVGDYGTRLVRDGRECIKLNKEGSKTIFVYVDVNNKMLYEPKDARVGVEVDYFDEGHGKFTITYDGLTGNFTDGEIVQLEDTGEWKTHTFYLYDAEFANGFLATGGAWDFRIGEWSEVMGMTNEDVILGGIRVSQGYYEHEVNVIASTEHTGNIFDTADEKVFNLNMENNTAAQQETLVEYTVTDIYGNAVETGKLKKSVKGKEKTDEKLTIKTSKNGVYVLNLKVTTTGPNELPVTYEEQQDFSVMNKFKEGEKLNETLGTAGHTSWGHDVYKSMELITAAGMGAWRDEYGWDVVERAKGDYKKSDMHDENVNAMYNAGVYPLFIACYGNPLYDEYRSVPQTDEGIKAYAKYAAFLAEQYKGKIKAIEIWNEYNIAPFNPNMLDAEHYVKMLKACYQEIKKVNPDIPVIGIDCAGVDIDFMKKVFDAGGYEYMDVVSVHPYYVYKEQRFADQEWAKWVLEVKDLMKQYGEPKEIWLTEVGWPTHKTEERTEMLQYTDEQQGKYQTRMYMTCRANDFGKRIFMYGFEEKGIQPGNPEHHFGIVRSEYNVRTPLAAKPALIAVAAMNKLIGNSDYVDSVYFNEDTSAHRFTDRDSNEQTIAIWSSREDNVSLNLGATEVTVIDLYGNIVDTFRSQNGIYQFDLNDDQYYIKGKFTAFSKADTDITTEYPHEVVKGNTFNIKVADKQKRNLRIDVKCDDAFTIEENNGVVNGDGKVSMKVMKEDSDLHNVFVNIYEGEQIVLSSRYTIKIGSQMSGEFMLVTTETTPRRQRLVNRLKNRTDSTTISGSCEIIAPEELASAAKKTRFLNVRPGDTVSVPINLPEQLTTRSWNITMRYELDDGTVWEDSGHINETVAQKADTPPVIDGVLANSEWKSVLFEAKSKSEAFDLNGAWGGEKDISLTGRVMYDSENLYLGLTVKDNAFVQENTGADIWNGDCVQLAIEDFSEEERDANTSKFTDIGIAQTKDGPTIWRYNSCYDLPSGEIKNAEAKIKRIGTETIYEIKIPFSELFKEGYVLKADKTMGFSIVVNDADNKERKGWIEYNSGVGRDKNSKLFGTLKFAS